MAAVAAVAGIALPDLLCSVQMSRRPEAGPDGARGETGVQVKKAVTVKRTPDEVYRFWRDFGNLPRFMRHLESVQVTGDRSSHWKATAPAGKTVEWDAQIVEDRPNELIAWQSLPGADVDNSGRVRFVPAPRGRGTEVRVDLRYDPPGGALGQVVAKLSGESPDQQVYGDLRRLKQLLETGEVIRSDASLERTGLPQRPAQPPERAPAYATAR